MCVSVRPPDLLDSEFQLRVYHIYPLARSVGCLLVHLFLLVLRFARRFKVVLGTTRITQSGGDVIIIKAQTLVVL